MLASKQCLPLNHSPAAKCRVHTSIGTRKGGCPTRLGSSVTRAQKQQFASFEDMLARSEVPILVDFYATWCGPCQMLSPVLSSVANKLKGRVQVVKIDTDRYPKVASQHKVQALPTIALFKGGQMVFRFEGMLNEAELLQKLEYYLPRTVAS